MPAVLLAFANDWVDDKRHLRSLLEESKAIDCALAPLARAGLEVLHPLHNATVDDVISAFRAHHSQINVFHFGGHATGSTLRLEDDTGKPADAHAKGLASFLGDQPGLVLVFLNGCTTEPQVKQLRAAGVKAVVATTRDINDKVAAEFAKQFYTELATRPLRSAFDTAVHALQTRSGDDPRAVTRNVVPYDESTPPSWPWVFDCDPAYSNWTLRSAITRRPWWRPLILAAAAVGLLLSLSFALSAETRRAACRLAGLRPLCAAIGIGSVPTDEEQALWDQAVAQCSGDGLRAYLQHYPTGAYAHEVQSRLDTCMSVRVEALGPERTTRYGWIVDRDYMRLFATEQAAHDDALRRGRAEAARYCEPLATNHYIDILSTSIEPEEWKCIDKDHQFTCGFRGTIVCSIRDRIYSLEERCHPGCAAEKPSLAGSSRDQP